MNSKFRELTPWLPIVLATVLLFGSAPVAASHGMCGSPHAGQGAAQTGLAQEAPYLADNETAMTKMMDAMAVKPTGNVDRDFVSAMVPHHQGAIEMAIALLRYGRNERLKRLAQEIIVTQQQEIAAMEMAVGNPLPPSAASPTQVPSETKKEPK
jgi:hypothetical protein